MQGVQGVGQISVMIEGGGSSLYLLYLWITPLGAAGYFSFLSEEFGTDIRKLDNLYNLIFSQNICFAVQI